MGRPMMPVPMNARLGMGGFRAVERRAGADAEARRTKYEARNKSEAQMAEAQRNKARTAEKEMTEKAPEDREPFRSFGHLDLVLVSCFVLQISCFPRSGQCFVLCSL